METIKEFFKNDTFAEYVGIELLEVEKGRAKAKLEIKKEHLNGVNIVHGGAIYTLADLVFAVASNSHGNVAVAISGSIAYFKAVAEGTLFAEAQEVSLNAKLATYKVSVTDAYNNMIAIFQGMVYRKKESIPNQPKL